MRQIRLLLVFPLLLALVAVLAACGGDEAPSDEEYFRKMDEVDKEVDKKFEDINCDETATAKQCATGFADGVSFAEPKYEDVKPAKDAENEHKELVAAIKELREKLEGAEGDFTDDDPAEAFFESFDTTRADAAFCAIQDLADQKNIEADVGCHWRERRSLHAPGAGDHRSPDRGLCVRPAAHPGGRGRQRDLDAGRRRRTPYRHR